MRPCGGSQKMSAATVLSLLCLLSCCPSPSLSLSPYPYTRTVINQHQQQWKWQWKQPHVKIEGLPPLQRRHPSIHHSPTTTVLQSTNSDSNNKNNRRKRDRVPVLLQTIKLKTKSILTFPIQTTKSLKQRFKSLSKRGRVLFTMQILIFGLLLGSSAQRVATKVGLVGSGGGAARTTRVVASRPVEVPYSTFMDLAERSGKGHVPGENPAIQIDKLMIGKDRINFQISQDSEKHQEAIKNNPKLVESKDISVQPSSPTDAPPPPRSAYAMKVNASPDLIEFLRKNQIPFKAVSIKGQNLFGVVARSSIFIIYMLFLLRMYRTMSGSGGGSGGSGDVPGKVANGKNGRGNAAGGEEAKITFEDIEGIDEAKFEVMELVDALRNPGKYSILGARAPTGLLLEGPPGTGKTMLARACAATAGVPLLYCSGSDFVEMFVGRGAARVRKTFARAGKMAPCIVFIDELDALGKSRFGAGEMMGMNMRSNDEAEQTLNQLLACMDGLDSTRGICVLAATNRRDVLDPALIRPGRFDRIIKVQLPNATGRENILRVHSSKLPGFEEGQGIDEKRPGSLGKGTKIDLSAVAAVTAGLSGAELEFIVNEAAIRAVRRVSAALREGVNPDSINAQVNAQDYEESVRNYYDTRKPNGVGKMSDVFNSVLRPKMS